MKPMKRALILLLLLSVIAVAVVLTGRKRPAAPARTQRFSVVATFYPLAEIARRVGGDRVDVLTLTPPGAEPHDYEPTPRDIAAAGAGRVFLMNGGVDA